MTRNLGTCTGTSDSSNSRPSLRRDPPGNEELDLHVQSSLRKFVVPASSRRSEAGATASLLGAALTGPVAESRRARRERVTRSWNGGYGSLGEGNSASQPGEVGGAGGGRRAYPVNVPQQQFLRSLQRASSTILTRGSSAVSNSSSGNCCGGGGGHISNNNNCCNHYHNSAPSPVRECSGRGRGNGSGAEGARVEAADAARPSRIDVLLMPSLKSLVSRRPVPGTSSRDGAGASASSSSGPCDMGGSSSSSVAAGNSRHHHLKSKSTAAMVPLMKRQPSCVSLATSIRVGGGGDLDGPAGASDASSSPPSSPGAGPGSCSGSGAGGCSGMRKCETVLALSNLGAMLRSASSSRTTLHVEPLKPVNRLRVPPQSPAGESASRMCSRCSSLLSMASSSRYSLNTAGGFVQCGAASPADSQTLLCKLCLVEVPLASTCEILQCGCCFCKDCLKTYIEFEIHEGAYDISCPDAQCCKQGVISMSEIENLVNVELVEKHRKFRLNREVDLDVNRTWCPRAGCETVCSVCPMERCQPQSVHCPTCTSDFCSNCKNPWHSGLTCEENSQRLAKDGMPDNMEPGIPFDSDLIKCCPMCNVPIEKDEGCAQMMCKRCKHVFCWYCLASLDDDFLLRHYDKGPCKNKLGHSRASVIWHRTQVIGIFAGFGILLLVASPLLLLAAPCIVCCKCRICSGGSKLDSEDEMPEESAS